MLVFDTYDGKQYTLRNPRTNDVWIFDSAMEAKIFVDAYFAEDVRCIVNYDQRRVA